MADLEVVSDCTLKMETGEEVSDAKIVFELIDDETCDPFCRKFVADNLIQLKNYESATKYGFVMDAWYKKNVNPSDVTGFIRFDRPFNHVELKYSYMKNARFATANGTYGIRGLTLAWDSAIWGLLREIESVPCSNPFSFPSCDGISRIIKVMEYRPEATESAKALCRVTVAIQYAMSILYGYDRCGSLPKFLRCLIDELYDLHERMRNMSLMPTLRIRARDLQLIQGILPERICQQLNVPMSPEACLSDAYYECVEMTMESIFDKLCGCKECCTRAMERFKTMECAKIGSRFKGTKNREPFFEENSVRISSYPNLGVIKLPKVRHLDRIQQTLICKYLSNDLMFNLHFGTYSAISRVEGVPLPFTAVKNMDIDLAYALYLATNVHFMCFLVKTVRQVIRTEEAAYKELVLALIKDATMSLRDGVVSRVRAGAEMPVFVASDPRDSGITDEERDLALAGALERLTFEGVENSEQYGTIGGFCRDAAMYMDLVEAHRVPRALREHRAREDVLLHTFSIKRMYDERPLPKFYGEKLIPYHVFVGGYRRRDGALIRMKGVTLSDLEIARGHHDLISARLRVYNTGNDVDMIKNVCVRKETLMMDMDRMYIPKVECSRAVSDYETDESSTGDEMETDISFDAGEVVVEPVHSRGM
uniref:Protein UL27 n=1 Tax=Mastomys natalensis cytomegalovirus 2 TaxID=2973540 RepID=A0A9Y1IQU3_9BETA|nr:protein UL27 [Mastomys natalensis cytomegalovirus 2]